MVAVVAAAVYNSVYPIHLLFVAGTIWHLFLSIFQVVLTMFEKNRNHNNKSQEAHKTKARVCTSALEHWMGGGRKSRRGVKKGEQRWRVKDKAEKPRKHTTHSQEKKKLFFAWLQQRDQTCVWHIFSLYDDWQAIIMCPCSGTNENSRNKWKFTHHIYQYTNLHRMNVAHLYTMDHYTSKMRGKWAITT